LFGTDPEGFGRKASKFGLNEVVGHKMKIEINHMLCIFICSRLLSLHKLGVIHICPLLKSEYLFFAFAGEKPKFSASRARGAVLLS
jgi:hypothetical protein